MTYEKLEMTHLENMCYPNWSRSVPLNSCPTSSLPPLISLRDAEMWHVLLDDHEFGIRKGFNELHNLVSIRTI